MADAYRLEKRYLRHVYRELLDEYLLPYYDLKGTPEYTKRKREWREARQDWRDTEWNDRSGRKDRNRRRIAGEWWYNDDDNEFDNLAPLARRMRPLS